MSSGMSSDKPETATARLDALLYKKGAGPLGRELLLSWANHWLGEEFEILVAPPDFQDLLLMVALEYAVADDLDEAELWRAAENNKISLGASFCEEPIEHLSPEGKAAFDKAFAHIIWLASNRTADQLELLGRVGALPALPDRTDRAFYFDGISRISLLNKSQEVSLDVKSRLPEMQSAWRKLGMPEGYFAADKLDQIFKVAEAHERAKSGGPSPKAYINSLTGALGGRPKAQHHIDIRKVDRRDDGGKPVGRKTWASDLGIPEGTLKHILAGELVSEDTLNSLATKLKKRPEDLLL